MENRKRAALSVRVRQMPQRKAAALERTQSFGLWTDFRPVSAGTYGAPRRQEIRDSVNCFGRGELPSPARSGPLRYPLRASAWGTTRPAGRIRDDNRFSAQRRHLTDPYDELPDKIGVGPRQRNLRSCRLKVVDSGCRHDEIVPFPYADLSFHAGACISSGGR